SVTFLTRFSLYSLPPSPTSTLFPTRRSSDLPHHPRVAASAHLAAVHVRNIRLIRPALPHRHGPGQIDRLAPPREALRSARQNPAVPVLGHSREGADLPR